MTNTNDHQDFQNLKHSRIPIPTLDPTMPGPTHRVAYNAKGRQSTAGSRKKGKSQKKDRSEVGPGEVESDPNASILVPKSKEDKDSERKAKLLQEVGSLKMA